MTAILVTCPATQSTVATGQHATAKDFEKNDFGGSFRCASCNQVHSWTKSQARLAAPLRSR